MLGEIKPSGGWGLEVWVGVIGILATIIFGIVAVAVVKDVRDWLRNIVHAYWGQGVLGLLAAFILVLAYGRRGVLGLLAAFIVCCFVFALWVVQRLRNWRPYRKYNRGRWEKMGTIYYGHLEYEPFLYYQHGNPSGLGVTLLERLLKVPLDGKKVNVEPFGSKRNWGDILDGLVEGKYDIVATPLFATFDRSKHVAFTTPLCFSNVGLYVNKKISDRFENMTIENMESAIQDAGKLVFLSVKGEISEKLAVKYKGSITSRGSGILLSSLFKEIAESTHPRYALFCESFYADEQPEVKSEAVVNVLPSHGILYPVCFAVRLGDYQLVNLLNIRLLQFNQNGGALPLLAEEWRKSRGEDVDLESMKTHFVAEWPCQPKISVLKDGTNA